MKTVKDLANELGVSDQTIRNEAKNQNITQTKKGKYYYFGDDDAERIITAISSRTSSKRFDKKTQNSNQTNDFVKLLEKELEAKNAQIERLEKDKAFLMKQLEDSAEALKAVQESLRAAQVIAQTATLRIPQHDERSWWQRLFGIRKKADGDQGEV